MKICAKISLLLCIPLCSFMFSSCNSDLSEQTFCTDAGLEYKIIDNHITITGYSGASDEITIPDSIDGKSVVEIAKRAFNEREDIAVVTIPDSVTQIGKAAFCRCENLIEVTLPSGITSIENDTFWHCQKLTKIVIPSGVTIIGENAFLDCDDLVDVTIPDTVTEVGYRAFSSCAALRELTLPDSVTKIGAQVFFYCDSRTRVTYKGKTYTDAYEFSSLYLDING